MELSCRIRQQLAAARQGERGCSAPGASVNEYLCGPGDPSGKCLDVPKGTLHTLLDAVRRSGKQAVEVAGIRLVVSKLGGRIAAFNRLSLDAPGVNHCLRVLVGDGAA